MSINGITIEPTDIPHISRVYAQTDVDLKGTYLASVLQVAQDNGRIATERGQRLLQCLAARINEELHYRFLLIRRPSEASAPWSVQSAILTAEPFHGRQTTAAAGFLFGATCTNERLGLNNVVVAHAPHFLNFGHGKHPTRLLLRRGVHGDDLYATWSERRDGDLTDYTDAVLMAY